MQIMSAKELDELAFALDVHNQQYGARGEALADAPAASAYARRLSEQILEKESRPQAFDWIEYSPKWPYAIFLYVVSGVTAAVYSDLSAAFTRTYTVA